MKEAVKNEAGQWLVLSDEKKKAMSDFLEEMAKYEVSLHSLVYEAEFFIKNQAGMIKPEAVSIERAKYALKALSEHFDEKKRSLEVALERIAKEINVMTGMIAELDGNKFYHRIEKIKEVIDKLKPHTGQFNALVAQLDELKKAKLEEAKVIIMKGHRKGYFDGL
jgi:hypothetical protein